MREVMAKLLYGFVVLVCGHGPQPLTGSRMPLNQLAPFHRAPDAQIPLIGLNTTVETPEGSGA